MNWTDEEIKWLVENSNKYSRKESTRLLNERFGNSRSENSVFKEVSKLKLENGRYLTEEQKEWLAKNYRLSCEELPKAFLEKFGISKTNKTLRRYIEYLGKAKKPISTKEERDLIKSLAPYYSYPEIVEKLEKDYGIHRAISFVSKVCNGIEKDEEAYKRIMYGRLPPNTMNVGDVRVLKSGIPYIKVSGAKNTGFYSNWKPLKDFVWESHNGKIPKGYHVTELDRDPLNCNISNLEIIRCKDQGLITINNLWSNDPEITSTAIKWAKYENSLRDLGLKRKRNEEW